MDLDNDLETADLERDLDLEMDLEIDREEDRIVLGVGCVTELAEVGLRK